MIKLLSMAWWSAVGGEYFWGGGGDCTPIGGTEPPENRGVPSYESRLAAGLHTVVIRLFIQRGTHTHTHARTLTFDVELCKEWLVGCYVLLTAVWTVRRASSACHCSSHWRSAVEPSSAPFISPALNCLKCSTRSVCLLPFRPSFACPFLVSVSPAGNLT